MPLTASNWTSQVHSMARAAARMAWLAESLGHAEFPPEDIGALERLVEATRFAEKAVSKVQAISRLVPFLETAYAALIDARASATRSVASEHARVDGGEGRRHRTPTAVIRRGHVHPSSVVINKTLTKNYIGVLRLGLRSAGFSPKEIVRGGQFTGEELDAIVQYFGESIGFPVRQFGASWSPKHTKTILHLTRDLSLPVTALDKVRIDTVFLTAPGNEGHVDAALGRLLGITAFSARRLRRSVRLEEARWVSPVKRDRNKLDRREFWDGLKKAQQADLVVIDVVRRALAAP